MAQITDIHPNYHGGAAFAKSVGEGFQRGANSQFEQAMAMERQKQASDLQLQRYQQQQQMEQQQQAQQQSRLQQTMKQIANDPRYPQEVRDQANLYAEIPGNPEIAKNIAAQQAASNKESKDRAILENLTKNNNQGNIDNPPNNPVKNPPGPSERNPEMVPKKNGRPFDDNVITALSHKFPTVARDMRSQNDAWDKRDIEENKANRKEKMEIHKESKEYDQDLINKTKVAKGQIETLKDIDKAIKSGNIKPNSIANIFKGMGVIGDKISQAVLNKDESTLLSSIPQLLEGWKDVFGVRLSDADLNLLQDKLPSIGKNQEANQSVLRVLKKYADMTLLRSQIADDIKEKNSGFRPLGYANQIEQRFDEMVQSVKIVNPNNGKLMEIPAYKLSEAIKSGAKLANE
jgi:hypothetical protein